MLALAGIAVCVNCVFVTTNMLTKDVMSDKTTESYKPQHTKKGDIRISHKKEKRFSKNEN